MDDCIVICGCAGGGDSVIPYRSLEGAVTVEILNAMARGEHSQI